MCVHALAVMHGLQNESTFADQLHITHTSTTLRTRAIDTIFFRFFLSFIVMFHPNIW